ncbi:major facilitator superfamily domain-containing protein [Zopfochytrium polystomum]|nr:major facilitator superfamily domain-containing protein [Zopfochytrium polystomum]
MNSTPRCLGSADDVLTGGAIVQDPDGPKPLWCRTVHESPSPRLEAITRLQLDDGRYTGSMATRSSSTSSAYYSESSANFDSLLSSGESFLPDRRRHRRHHRSLFRRGSSFGGAPIVVQTKLPEPTVLKKQSSSKIRWIILLLSCFLLFGNFYAYDNPAALNKPLQEFLNHHYDRWQYELNLLYSVYSFPNMFLPLIGGQLVDRFDTRKVLLAFSACVCIGQTLFAVGVSIRSYSVMVFGRILFGIGGESVSVVQSSVTTSWFKGKELAFALGLNICISRLGSVANAILSPRIAKSVGTPAAVWAGTLACYISFLCAVVLCLFIEPHARDKSTYPQGGTNISATSEATTDWLPRRIRSTRSFNPSPLAVADTIEEETPLLHDQSNVPAVATAAVTAFTHRTSIFAEIQLLPTMFWMICLVGILLYGTVIPFNNIASDFLMSKWYPGDTETAGLVMSIPDSMSAVLVPISGFFVDRYGYRASSLTICALTIGVVHLVLGLTMVNPVFPLIFLGLSYSIYGVALWPSVATIVLDEEKRLSDALEEATAGFNSNQDTLRMDFEPPKLLGTAYGLSTAALNTALAIMPLFAAEVRVVAGSFTEVELLFAFFAFVGVAVCVTLWVMDKQAGGLLERPETQIAAPLGLEVNPNDSELPSETENSSADFDDIRRPSITSASVQSVDDCLTRCPLPIDLVQSPRSRSDPALCEQEDDSSNCTTVGGNAPGPELQQVPVKQGPACPELNRLLGGQTNQSTAHNDEKSRKSPVNAR